MTKTYTLEERRAIVMEARRTAKELLDKIEQLAQMDGSDEVLAKGAQDGDAGGV